MVFREHTYSVLIVSASEKFNSMIMSLLPMSEYWPVNTVHNVAEARRMLLSRSYDLVIINAPLPDDFGTRLAMDICSDSNAGVMLFVKSDTFEDIYNKVLEYGVVAIPKPTSTVIVSQTLRTMCATCERLRRMKTKQVSVEKKIEEIRLINHAKWLLIECLSMTEPDAHRYIEKQAMDLRISKQEAAENIIKAYQ